MARVRKTILKPGVYQSPDGEVVATPARLRKFAATCAKMSQAGNKIPVPWGHHSNAVPGQDTDPDFKAFASSRYNAGYTEGMSYDPKEGLVWEANLPGVECEGGQLVTMAELPDGRKVKTVIDEVSVAIAPRFKDGQGNVYEDAITHIALTPLPVMGHQKSGFAKLATAPEGTVFLSLVQHLAYSEDDMADDEELEATDEAGGMAGDEGFDRLKGLLGDHGITLPEDTTPENLTEHLIVALTALQGKLTPVGEEEEPEVEDEGVTVEEPVEGGVMMSLEGQPRIVVKMVEREQRRLKDAAKAKISQLRKNGLPADVSDQLESELGTFRLGLTAEADAVEPPRFGLTAVLGMLERAQKRGMTKSLTKRLATTTEQASPLHKGTDADAERERKMTDKLADMAMGRWSPKAEDYED